MHLKDTLTSYERRQALVLQAIARPLIYLHPVHPTKAATKRMYWPQATSLEYSTWTHSLRQNQPRSRQFALMTERVKFIKLHELIACQLQGILVCNSAKHEIRILEHLPIVLDVEQSRILMKVFTAKFMFYLFIYFSFSQSVRWLMTVLLDWKVEFEFSISGIWINVIRDVTGYFNFDIK